MKRIAMIAGGLLVAHTGLAGVYVETVDHNLTTNSTQLKQKIYVQNGDGRFVDAHGRATLIKGGMIYMIDDASRSYVIFDKATMEQFANKMNADLEKIKAQIAKLPPDQRAQAEQELGGLGGDDQAEKWTVEVEDTGKSDKVDGRNCRLWNVARNGELDEQICVVPYSALPGKENFQAVFATFARAFEEMAKSAPMLRGMIANEFSAQVKANGYPVRRRNYEDGKLVDEEMLVKVWREEAIPASMFTVPADYQKKQMPTGQGQ